jgi:hypothetical protein
VYRVFRMDSRGEMLTEPLPGEDELLQRISSGLNKVRRFPGSHCDEGFPRGVEMCWMGLDTVVPGMYAGIERSSVLGLVSMAAHLHAEAVEEEVMDSVLVS